MGGASEIPVFPEPLLVGGRYCDGNKIGKRLHARGRRPEGNSLTR
jgi:hypothetical protein